MIRCQALLLTVVVLGCADHPSRSAWQPAPSSASAAAGFIAELSLRSPSHDGAPLRTYEIRDLDSDGIFEVLERRSHFERSPAFLNAELGPAFEWITVYRQAGGTFAEATGSFRWFLTLRKHHYEHWLRLLREPAALSQDSKNLIAANPELHAVVSSLLARAQSLLGEPAA